MIVTTLSAEPGTGEAAPVRPDPATLPDPASLPGSASRPDPASLPGSASDAPLREPGTRTRSGNAMLRTRAAILEAAAGCVARTGVRKTTMGQVAAAGGVAKATLYNHFRTKDDLLAALVDARVAALGDAGLLLAGGVGLAGALEHAAHFLAADPALRQVASDAPEQLLPLTVPGPGRGWARARECTREVLTAAAATSDAESVDLVLRWLVGQVLWPATPSEAQRGAAVLGSALAARRVVATPNALLPSPLPSSPLPSSPLPSSHVPPSAVPAVPVGVGVGWPA